MNRNTLPGINTRPAAALGLESLEDRTVPDASYWNLSTGGPFRQDWSNTGLITTNDVWTGVPSIIGYRGDGLTAGVGTDPRTLTANDATPTVDVNENQTDPNTFTTAGVTEFEITNPTVALAGSATASAPYLQLHLNTTGITSASGIQVSFTLRDLDSTANDATQQVNVQYRLGTTAAWTNVTNGYVADATVANASGPDIPLSVTLPLAANNQSQVQVRIMTTNATGTDEWVGVDDIRVTANPVVALTGTPLLYTLSTPPAQIDTAASVTDGDNLATNLANGSLSVSFSAGGTTADQLSIQNQGTAAGQIGVSGSNVTFGGATIATFSGGTNGTTLVVSFTTSNATVAAVSALAKAITYQNLGTSTAPRQVQFAVNDGAGGSGSASRTITYNTPPSITSDGAGATASKSVAENTTAVTTVTATDPETPAQTLTYSISGGADAAKFSIVPTTGVLRFVSAQDFENPTDAGLDNVYDVTVQVSDGKGGTDTQAIAVTVTDAPVGSFTFNQSTFLQNEGNIGSSLVTIQIDRFGGSDAGSVDYATSDGTATAGVDYLTTMGTLMFGLGTTSRTFSVTLYGDRTLEPDETVVLTLSNPTNGAMIDGSSVASNPASVTILNDDNAPVITSNGGGPTATVSVPENTTTVTTVTATDADGPSQTLTYSIQSVASGGAADAAKFAINPTTGVLTFVTPPDFEAPTDTGADNVYDVTVQVSDNNGGTDAQIISVTVTNAAVGSPTVTPATTSEEVQTASGLVVTPNPVGETTTSYQITAITGGTLFQNDGTTAIASGSFITAAEGAAGLKFTPSLNFFGNATFKVQASSTGTSAGLGGAAVTATITVNPVADTPSVSNSSTSANVQTTTGLVVTANAVDGGSVTNYQITAITNGRLFLKDGVTAITNGAFITVAEGALGLKFTPNTDFIGTGSFKVQAATSASPGGLGGSQVTASILVVPAFTPTVTNASTRVNVQSATGLVISKNTADGGGTAFYQITAIANGTLFQNDGVTAIANGAFITVAQGAAGLKFTPATNFVGNGSFKVQAATGASTAALVDSLVTARITVGLVASTPTVTNAVTNQNTQTRSGLVVRPNAADAGATAFYKITGITNGQVFLSNGTTPVSDGSFITVAQGAAGLKFTPGTDLNSTNASFGFTVQASTNASNAGLGGSPVAASVVVNPANGSQPVAPQLGSVQYIAVGADAGAPGVARLSDAQTGATVLDYRPFGGSYGGGIQVALGDQNGDGVDELVAATATGAAHVKVRDLKTGAEVRSFLPFGGYMGGLTLSTADVDGDGKADIVVGTATQTTHVKVFSGATGAELRSFIAFPGYSGGVKVAAGDTNGDGFADIAVVAGAGGNGHIKVLDGRTGAVTTSFLGYTGYLGEINLAVGDVDGDGKGEVITGALAAPSVTHLKAFGTSGQPVRSCLAPALGTEGVRRDRAEGPARIAVDDANGDGVVDYLLGTAPGTPNSQLLILDGVTGGRLASRVGFEALFGSGVYVDLD
ncbi:MAG: beta strand repeat-containing protein [Gemmata sp.]